MIRTITLETATDKAANSKRIWRRSALVILFRWLNLPHRYNIEMILPNLCGNYFLPIITPNISMLSERYEKTPKITQKRRLLFCLTDAGKGGEKRRGPGCKRKSLFE